MAAIWNNLPYWVTGALIRAAKVLLYGFVPALALYVVDSNLAAFEIAIRATISAALLALIDKGAREYRAASDAGSDATDPVIDDTPAPPVIAPDPRVPVTDPSATDAVTDGP